MNNNQGLPLVELATAYQSLRDSGFDFSTAIGELIDNSVQANAQRIDIIPRIEQKETDGKVEVIPAITQIAVVDDGDGMDEKTLNGCLQLGFSTRYNDRKGLGRFGVGATSASISQCKRTIFCSRPKGTGDFLATYIDLDEIADNTQTVIPKPSPIHLPKDLKNINFDNSSTIVVWSQCDRLQHDANGRPTQADELLTELKNWVSRAYRYIIWTGVEIFINDERVLAHDPLYLNASQTGFPDAPLATERFSTSIIEWEIPNVPEKTSFISVKLTILPEEWRRTQGDGGRPHARERRIDENQDISILRHHREVAFANLYPMVPSQEHIDRWWGCEINFEPELDECWEVKNIKKGARPIKELRNKIKKLLDPEIHKLRREIRSYWKTGVPADSVRMVRKTALSLIREDNSVTVPEVESYLQEMEISAESVALIMEELAIERTWDWQSDGTHRKYILSQLSPSESEREMFFKDIRDAIENSEIDRQFKDIALYDLEQAKISYESRAFKACIVMFGAVVEGLMLGMIRKDTTLSPMIATPKDAPKAIQDLGLKPHSKPEDLADKISEKLGFDQYKSIILHLKPQIEKLKIEGIQNFRNAIHPWKSIKEPDIFIDPSPVRAMHHLTALSLLAEKILA